jgi:two-component system, sensor histidine kinase and response regulator
MGIGIWSMHYMGMEGFRLPIEVRYDWPTVLLSMVASISASAVALFVVSRKTMGITATIIGSMLMGGGIAAMHYIGMEAMRLPAMLDEPSHNSSSPFSPARRTRVFSASSNLLSQILLRS